MPGLQTVLCKTRVLATSLFKNSVFGIVALVIATLHLMRPSIVLLTGGLIAAGFGIVLYNIGLSGLAIGAAYSGICTARACHSVSASSRYIAQVHSDCQFSGPSLKPM